MFSELLIINQPEDNFRVPRNRNQYEIHFIIETNQFHSKLESKEGGGANYLYFKLTFQN